MQLAVKGLNTYAMSLGESVSSGPFFKAYVVNLLPGQFVQPFVDAAFSDLGLDPATLLPSELTEPPTGQPATPAFAGALPADRPRWRASSHSARRDHRQPRQSGVRFPGLPLPGPGCYPYREPPSTAPARRPAAGPARSRGARRRFPYPDQPRRRSITTTPSRSRPPGRCRCPLKEAA